MSITWVHEALASGSGKGSHDSGNQYVRLFDVMTDDYADNALTVANADDGTTAIPKAYSHFQKGNDTDYTAVVTEIAPERDARLPLLWHVRVVYTVLQNTAEGGTFPGGSLNVNVILPSIRIWGIPIKEVLREDVTGKPFANSAGELFTPLPEDVYYIRGIEITWWAREYQLGGWEAYEDSTNAETIWGCYAGTLLMVGPPKGTRKVDTYGTYWELRTEIHYNKRGWTKKLADMGTVKLVTASGEPPSASAEATGVMPITDQAGRAVGSPTPLDGEGQPLAQDAPWVIKEWDVKLPASWTALNLPPLNVTF